MNDNSALTAPNGKALFGRPIFNDPAARALGRVGVIDVGSNSVRLVVFDGAARSPAYFYNEKIMCGLGRGLAESNHLNPEGRLRALAALKRFAQVAQIMNVAPLLIVATAAVREAEDGPAFCDEVKAATGLTIRVIEGTEEARLSAQGVLLGWPRAKGLVCDIGGASMELAEVGEGAVGTALSAKLGPMALASLNGGKKARAHFIDATLETMLPRFNAEHKTLYLVGGSWRAIAKIDMERRAYPLQVLHEYKMRPQDIRETAQYISLQDLESLRNRCGLSAARMALVPIASEVLLRLLAHIKPREIAISSYGIREGILYDEMPKKLRRRDPLIEACRFAEAKDARLPGFGRALHRFIAPLFPKVSSERYRLMRAACLLHDVSWRAHPDYRAEICFEEATRSNLGGLSHPERVYLGLALLHRYRNRRPTRFDALAPMLSGADTKQAEVLGKALRFGSMFCGLDRDMFGVLTWRPRKKKLQLVLPDGPGRDLYGEVAAARLRSLAEALEAEVEVI